ncbi:hypothetical protein ACVWZV_000100 [Bradyrhizobium sp. GM5.1]
MRKPPLDPDVADAAPTDQILTVYDEQHLVTYMRLLQAESEKGLTGQKWLGSCCIWIRSANGVVRAAHTRVTWRALSG